jgi:hypothetical protein
MYSITTMRWLTNQLRMNLLRYLRMLPNKFSEFIFFHITHLYIYIYIYTLDYSVQIYVYCQLSYIHLYI